MLLSCHGAIWMYKLLTVQQYACHYRNKLGVRDILTDVHTACVFVNRGFTVSLINKKLQFYKKFIKF